MKDTWYGEHNRSRYSPLVRRCMDKIAVVAGVDRITSRPYRRQGAGFRPGALMRITKAGQLELTIKQDGIFPFIVKFAPAVANGVARQIKNILQKEGLPVTLKKKIASGQPLYEQKSWLEQQVRQLGISNPSVLPEKIARRFNKDYRRKGDPFVYPEIILTRLKKFRLDPAGGKSDKPVGQGQGGKETIAGEEAEALVPDWEDLPANQQQGYLELFKRAREESGRMTVERPFTILKDVFGKKKGPAIYVGLKHRGLVEPVNPKKRIPPLYILHSLNNLPLALDEMGRDLAPAPKSDWELLTLKQQAAYRILYQRAEDMTPDGRFWIVKGALRLLRESMGVLSGAFRHYRALKEKGLLKVVVPNAGRKPAVCHLADLRMPSAEERSKGSRGPRLTAAVPSADDPVDVFQRIEKTNRELQRLEADILRQLQDELGKVREVLGLADKLLAALEKIRTFNDSPLSAEQEALVGLLAKLTLLVNRNPAA